MIGDTERINIAETTQKDVSSSAVRADESNEVNTDNSSSSGPMITLWEAFFAPGTNHSHQAIMCDCLEFFLCD